tara:strand:+ start:11 stop:571 length:561 start_codon:yes stop_codon:yes gene_type:complete
MLKKLKKYLESEKKDQNIFDIIIYGSTVKGKISPKDIDLIVIFLKGNLKDRLNKIQEIKSKLKKLNKNIDIKQIKLTDLFSSDFFARTGILLEGISLFKNKKLSEIIGFKAYTLFWYNLKKLNHTQKVKFNYILAGRNSQGIIKEFKGQRLVNGAIKIPINNSLEFEEILKNNNVNYNKKDILETI